MSVQSLQQPKIVQCAVTPQANNREVTAAKTFRSKTCKLAIRTITSLATKKLFSLSDRCCHHVLVVKGVREDFCWQHKGALQNPSDMWREGCNEIRHTLIDPLWGESPDGQYAVAFTDDGDRAKEWSPLQEGVWVFYSLVMSTNSQFSLFVSIDR